MTSGDLLSIARRYGFNMYRLLYGFALATLISLTACTRNEPNKTRGQVPPPARAFDTHWQTESQFIVESTVIDLAGMAYFGKYNRALQPEQLEVNALELQGSEGEPPKYQLHLSYPSAFDIEMNLAVTGSIWAPELYSDVVKRLFDVLQVDRSKASSETGPSHSSCLRDLTDPTASMVERVNNTVSAELQSNFLSPAQHEHAALLLAAFALREHSGMFFEIRSELCRMAAHLAYAHALQNGPPAIAEGKIATAALAALYEDQETALRLLTDVKTEDRSAQAWVRALRIRVTGDYRLIAGVKDLTLLERREAFEAQITGIEASVADRALPEHDELRGLTDWSRLLNSHHPSVQLGHEILERSVNAEIQEAQQVYLLDTASELERGSFIDKLNAEPEPCVSAGANNANAVRVIGWGHWANFLQRHLCHSIQSDFAFMQWMWGVPDEARKYRDTVDQQFGRLRLYPFVRRKNATEESYYRKAQDAEMAVVHHRPHLVPAAVWNEMSYKVPFAALYYPPPHPYVNEWHRINPLPGTAYNFFPRSYHPSLTGRKDVAALMSHLHTRAPYNNYVTHYYLYVRSGPGQSLHSDGPAMVEAYSPVLEFNSIIAGKVAEAYKAEPEQFEKWINRASSIDPFWNYTVGEYYAGKRRDADAARAYEQIINDDPDNVRMSQRCDWLVRYYERTGAADKAMALAKRAAEVYSEGGLETIAHLLEERGNYSGALQYYKKIFDRYNSETQLVGYLLRYERATGKSDSAPELRKMLADVLPHGLEPIEVGSLKSAPKTGIVLEKETEETRKAGLRLTDVIVGVRGYKVNTFAAYQAVRDLESNTPFVLQIWRDGGYREISAAPPDNRFGTPMHNYIGR